MQKLYKLYSKEKELGLNKYKNRLNLHSLLNNLF